MKRKLLWASMALIFLAVFNFLFFFLGGFDHPASVWISYGFLHFAYLMMIFSPIFAGKKKDAATFATTLTGISTTYFLFEAIIAIVFLVLRPESYALALILQVILVALYLFAFLGLQLANSYTAEAVSRQQEEVFFLKSQASRVKLLMGRMSDRQADRSVERVYDLLNSSPTRSVAEAFATEAEITDCISALESAVARDSSSDVIGLCNEIVNLTNERNQTLKLYN